MINKTTFLIILIFFMVACSTERNTLVTRTYHNITSKYNIYFNGNESFKNGLRRQDESFQYKYAKVLPIFKDSDPEIAASISSDMETAIRKATKLISLHSIKAKPELKKTELSERQKKFYDKKEFNKWVDDGYMLIGRAQFYKMDYISAEQTFLFIIDEFPEEPVKQTAQLWLARVYIATKEFDKAREILDIYGSNKKNVKKNYAFFHAVFADYYLQLQDYMRCIEYLQKAITKTYHKKTKTRYYFILGQLFERINNYQQASLMYHKVIKRNPPYEMAFNAMINAASLLDIQTGANKEIKKQLNKMLKDEKNKDYLDQIYYALGKISLQEKNQPQAIEYFRLSAAKSVYNNTQKVMSCLTLAELYFKIPNYSEAKKYYDSTVAYINSDYPDYQNILRNTQNLNDLVTNLNIVEYEDSLQRLAKMDENERNKIIDKLVNQAVEEEKKQKELAQSSKGETYYNQYELENFRSNLSETGKWYFYNTATLSFGQAEFVKKWGKRKLEDNWRRANKQMVQVDDEMMTSKDKDTTKTQKDDKSKFSKIDRNYYLADIPLTPEKLKLSNERIAEALFNAAKVYKEKLNDFPKAISTFETFVNRFPNHDNLVMAYYDLYLLHQALKNFDKAIIYKELIMMKFPESNYVKVLTNPNYIQDLENERLTMENFYIQTYSYYLEGNYAKTLENCILALEKYKESYLVPKFSFLKAVASGKLADQRTLKANLSEFKTVFPDDELANLANDIILKMEEIEFGLSKSDDLSKTDKDGISTDKIAEAIYKYKPDTIHYFVVVAMKSLDLNRFKFNITNFIVDHYNYDDYEIADEPLSTNYQNLLVKGLKNAKDALAFLNLIKQDAVVFKEFPSTSFQYFIISANNYPSFLKDRSVSQYLDFYGKNYK